MLVDELGGALVGRLKLFAIFFLGLVLGMLGGVQMADEAPDDLLNRLDHSQQKLRRAQDKIRELERGSQYASNQSYQEKSVLPPSVLNKHQEEVKRYTASMRQSKHLRAAGLVEWFISRWNELLAQPQPDDRKLRRAEVLEKFIGAMKENLNPGDFVPWQSEFLGQPWIAELGFDLDGDGYPARSGVRNPRDSFTNVSLCKIGMALNQALLDTQILFAPDVKCGDSGSRISLFLAGETLRDATEEYAKALKSRGYVVKELRKRNIQQLIVSSGRRR